MKRKLHYLLAVIGLVLANWLVIAFLVGLPLVNLGYVYREHWSSPILISRTYKAIGAAPDQQPVCETEITTLQKRFPGFYGLGGN
jgi:hypothetical protein